MEKKGVLRYLTNNHLSHHELLSAYNELLKTESEIRMSYHDLFSVYNKKITLLDEISDKYNKISVDYNSLIVKTEKIVEEYNKLKENRGDDYYIKMCEIFISNNEVIKVNINEMLDIIDNNKDNLYDNDYLCLMNYLKEINENLNLYN